MRGAAPGAAVSPALSHCRTFATGWWRRQPSWAARFGPDCAVNHLPSQDGTARPGIGLATWLLRASEPPPAHRFGTPARRSDRRGEYNVEDMDVPGRACGDAGAADHRIAGSGRQHAHHELHWCRWIAILRYPMAALGAAGAEATDRAGARRNTRARAAVADLLPSLHLAGFPRRPALRLCGARMRIRPRVLKRHHDRSVAATA